MSTRRAGARSCPGELSFGVRSASGRSPRCRRPPAEPRTPRRPRTRRRPSSSVAGSAVRWQHSVWDRPVFARRFSNAAADGRSVATRTRLPPLTGPTAGPRGFGTAQGSPAPCRCPWSAIPVCWTRSPETASKRCTGRRRRRLAGVRRVLGTTRPTRLRTRIPRRHRLFRTRPELLPACTAHAGREQRASGCFGPPQLRGRTVVAEGHRAVRRHTAIHRLRRRLGHRPRGVGRPGPPRREHRRSLLRCEQRGQELRGPQLPAGRRGHRQRHHQTHARGLRDSNTFSPSGFRRPGPADR